MVTHITKRIDAGERQCVYCHNMFTRNATEHIGSFNKRIYCDRKCQSRAQGAARAQNALSKRRGRSDLSPAILTDRKSTPKFPERNQCVYPLWKDDGAINYTFCCDHTISELAPYCDKHQKICYFPYVAGIYDKVE